MLLMDPVKYSLVMIVLGLFVIFPQVSFAQRGKKEKQEETAKEKGKLAQFEDEIEKRESRTTKSEGETHICYGDCCAEDDSYDWAYPFFEILFEGTYQALIGAPTQLPPGYTLREYSPYPYADPVFGRFGGEAARPMSFDVSAHYVYSNPTLDGFGFRTRFSPHPLLGLEFQLTEFHEQFPSGMDRMALFNLMVNFNRVRSPAFNLWWGLGIKGMHTRHTRTGFAYNLGMEIYPIRPISFQLVHNGGWLNGVYVPEFTGTMNLHLGRFAVMTGYQGWFAGSTTLDGFILGLKAHF